MISAVNDLMRGDLVANGNYFLDQSSITVSIRMIRFSMSTLPPVIGKAAQRADRQA